MYNNNNLILRTGSYLLKVIMKSSVTHHNGDSCGKRKLLRINLGLNYDPQFVAYTGSNYILLPFVACIYIMPLLTLTHSCIIASTVIFYEH
jgi:hypothetical protein